jgi:hypothetical protein
MTTSIAKQSKRYFNLNGEMVPVRTLDEGRSLWLAYRDVEGLGASDCERGCGEYSEDGRVVAHVSYNGRMWVGPAAAWTSSTQEVRQP